MTTQPKITTGDDDMRWVHEHMQELRPYQGQWIAVVECRGVASGSTVSDVLDRVEAQGLSGPFVTQIPDDIDRKLYFIG